MIRTYAVIAALIAMLGVGVYISVLRAQNHALGAEKALAEANAAQLKSALETEQGSVRKLQDLAALADAIMVKREQERVLSARRTEGLRNDLHAMRIQPDVKAWADEPVPDPVAVRLRAYTPGDPGRPPAADVPATQPDDRHPATGSKRGQEQR